MARLLLLVALALPLLSGAEPDPFYEGYIYGCYTTNVTGALDLFELIQTRAVRPEAVPRLWNAIDRSLAYAAQYNNPMNCNTAFDHPIKRKLDPDTTRLLVQLLRVRKRLGRQSGDQAREQQIAFLHHLLAAGG